MFWLCQIDVLATFWATLWVPGLKSQGYSMYGATQVALASLQRIFGGNSHIVVFFFSEENKGTVEEDEFASTLEKMLQHKTSYPPHNIIGKSMPGEVLAPRESFADISPAPHAVFRTSTPTIPAIHLILPLQANHQQSLTEPTISTELFNVLERKVLAWLRCQC